MVMTLRAVEAAVFQTAPFEICAPSRTGADRCDRAFPAVPYRDERSATRALRWSPKGSPSGVLMCARKQDGREDRERVPLPPPVSLRTRLARHQFMIELAGQEPVLSFGIPSQLQLRGNPGVNIVENTRAVLADGR